MPIDLSKVSFDFNISGVDILYDGEKIGYFLWRDIEEADGSNSHLITHMEIDSGYTHYGIGTETVKRIIEETGERVIFGNDDGTVSEDGSHLIEDGPRFVAHLHTFDWYLNSLKM